MTSADLTQWGTSKSSGRPVPGVQVFRVSHQGCASCEWLPPWSKWRSVAFLALHQVAVRDAHLIAIQVSTSRSIRVLLSYTNRSMWVAGICSRSCFGSPTELLVATVQPPGGGDVLSPRCYQLAVFNPLHRTSSPKSRRCKRARWLKSLQSLSYRELRAQMLSKYRLGHSNHG